MLRLIVLVIEFPAIFEPPPPILWLVGAIFALFLKTLTLLPDGLAFILGAGAPVDLLAVALNIGLDLTIFFYVESCIDLSALGKPRANSESLESYN
jgi:hypothetical protein